MPFFSARLVIKSLVLAFGATVSLVGPLQAQTSLGSVGTPAATTAPSVTVSPATSSAPSRAGSTLPSSTLGAAAGPSGKSVAQPSGLTPGALPGSPATAGVADGNTMAARATADQSSQTSTPETGQQPAAAAVRDTAADEVEFQRFVRNATGQTLRLYGYELFANPASYSAVLAAPVPANYQLGPGDELVLQVNGLADVNERLVIDRDGRVLIPKVGPLRLAGVAFGDAEKVVTAHLNRVFRNFTVSLSMGRLRSIEVFVVGQARKPGRHLVSSLSTLVNALFETGGPSANGSLRNIELRRAGKKVASIDLYAFLARGEGGTETQLLPGDIIYIPPAGPRAALLGTLNAPAIYELRPRETINDVLALSGGLPALAAPQKAQLDRLNAQQDIARYVQDFTLDAAGLATPLQAGDILTVFQISPQIGNVVTLQGNVASPLRYTFKPGMRVSDLLGDKRLLIPGSYWEQLNRGAASGNYSRPEVNLDYATLQRLDPLTLRTELIPFNLLKAVARQPAEDLELKSGDIVTVYRAQDPGPETADSITVVGEIVGGSKRFVWRPGFTIKDIIPSAQWLVEYYNYWQRPSARNLRNDINWDYAQVIRRVPETLSNQAVTFNLGNAVLRGNAEDNLRLAPGDQIALFTTTQMPLPLEKRVQMVTLAGEFNIPGRYQITPGETLPALIRRAGGLSKNAFAYGMVFSRESTRAQQQDNLDKSIRRLEAEVNAQVASNLQNIADTEKGATVQAQIAGQKLLLDRLKSLKASGRISLGLDPTQTKLPAIALEDGDQITVPQQPNFVGVFGEVLAETSFIHQPGSTVADYLDKAGLSRDADTDNIMVVRADGSVESGARRLSFLSAGVTGKKLYPGDTVFVPGVIDRRSAYTQFIQGAKDLTAVLYQFGLGAAALKTIRSSN